MALQLQPCTDQMQDWVLAKRKDVTAEFEPRAARALECWPVQVRDLQIAGITCQEVVPQDRPAKGTLLYFFGGGFISGCPEYDLPITAALAVMGDFRVIAPRYPLAPEYPFPAAVHQADMLYAALLEDTDLVGIVGESAGGALAMTVTQKALRDGLPVPRRLALLSPWGDLTPQGLADCAGIDDPSQSFDDIQNYTDAYLCGSDAFEETASPACVTFAAEWPPTLLTTGSRDILQRNTLDLHARLVAAGVDVTLTDIDGMCHVFEVFDEYPQSIDSLKTIAAFLGQTEGPA